MAPSASELATAYVSVSLSTGGMGKDLTKELGAAGDTAGAAGGERAGSSFMSKLGGFVKKSVGAVGLASGVAIGGMLAKGFADSFAQSDATTKFKQSLNFAGIAKSDIDKATKITQKYADDTVFDLSTVQNTAAQLAANGVKNFTGLTKAAGNLNAVAGGNADTFQGVAMALTQTVGAGKLTTENWNQIADAIPGASGVLQEALKKNGAFTGDFRDAMAKGQITAKEFNKALMQVGNRPIAVKAATSTATFEGAMGNLMATITGGFAGMLNKVKPQLTGFITTASTAVGKGFTMVSTFASDLAGRVPKMWAQLKVNPAVQASLDQLGKIWDTLKATAMQLWPSVKQIFTSLGQATKQLGVSSWSLFLGVAQTLASAMQTTLVPALKWVANFMKTNPKIVLLAVGAYTAYKTITTGISAATKLWAGAQRLLNLAMKANPIGLVITGLTLLAAGFTYLWEHSEAFRKFWKNLWNKIKSAAGAVINWFKTKVVPAVKPVFDTIGHLVGDVVGVFKGLWQFLSGIFTGHWSKAWNGIKKIFGSWWDGIKSILNLSVKFFSGVWGKIKGATKAAWNAIKSFIMTPVNAAKDGISTAFNAVKSFLSGAWSTIKSAASSAWGLFKSYVLTPVGAVRDAVTTAIGKVKDFLGNTWGTIKSAAQTAWKTIKGYILDPMKAAYKWVTGTFGKIGGWFSDLWSGIKQDATDILGGIGDAVSGAFNSIVGAIKWPINQVINAVNWAIRQLNRIHFSIPSWVPIVGGKSFGISIPQIPNLATGGVIEPTPGGTIVRVAEAGKPEIVSPVPLLKSVIDDALAARRGSGYAPLIDTVNIAEAMSPAQVAVEIDRRLAMAS